MSSCLSIAWITISGTPSSCRFVARPRRYACRAFPLQPVCLEPGLDNTLGKVVQIQRPADSIWEHPARCILGLDRIEHKSKRLDDRNDGTTPGSSSSSGSWSRLSSESSRPNAGCSERLHRRLPTIGPRISPSRKPANHMTRIRSLACD